MKVGIVTFWDATNYGAVLQLFALERALELLNIDVETISHISRQENVGLKNKLKIFFERIEVKLGFWNRKESFKEFRNRNLRLSTQVTTTTELKALAEKYDYIIAGSDQIWNYKLSKMNDIYFLNFTESKKKIAYAASFGVSEIPDGLRNKYIEGLEGFKHISVREKRGSEMIEDLINRSVPTVLDPTLLLNASAWKQWLSLKTFNDKRYVLVYCLRKSPYLMALARKICQAKGLELKVLNPKNRHAINKDSMNVASPQKFVELFYNAEYVLTNSFHGTVFSVNFNKKFYVELWPSVVGNTNSRMEGILEFLDLKDRIVNESIQIENFDKNIVWEKINAKLDVERGKSFQYLKDSLSVSEIL